MILDSYVQHIVEPMGTAVGGHMPHGITQDNLCLIAERISPTTATDEGGS